MSDEFSSDFPYEKRMFISKLNPESAPFLPSSYYQHIQEVQQPTFSSEDHKNHLHIQPIVNGHDDYNSTTIYSIEPSEHLSSQTHYIQETEPNNHYYSTTSSHIEPVNISDAEPLTETKQEDDDTSNTEHNLGEKPDELK
jgi:hypothetical protein